MALVPFNIDRLLEGTLGTMENAGWAPACNAYEDDHGFHIEVSLPGVDRQDMDILFEEGVLRVKGERKEPNADTARRYFIHEMGWGAFSRAFRLPSYVDSGKVSATYKDGVLMLGLPKRDEAKPRRIEISLTDS